MGATYKKRKRLRRLARRGITPPVQQWQLFESFRALILDGRGRVIDPRRVFIRTEEMRGTSDADWWPGLRAEGTRPYPKSIERFREAFPEPNSEAT